MNPTQLSIKKTHQEHLEQSMHVDIRRQSNGAQVTSGSYSRQDLLEYLRDLEYHDNDLSGTIFHLNGSITIQYSNQRGVIYTGTAKPI